MSLTILCSFYNAETYISRFVQQLKNQTEKDFRCIFVDDGSCDESFALCESAIASDERFSIIRHEQNKGLGAGRCTGIQNARTEFVTFMDADDEIAENAVEKMNSAIATHNADLIVFDYFKKDENGNTSLVTDTAKTVAELFEAKSPLISHVWHKVYKKSLLEKLNFSFYKNISFAEDLWLSTNCFIEANSVSFAHDSYYTYRYNSDSMVHSRTEKSIRENIAVLQHLLQNKKVQEFPEIEAYLKDDSFHAFGQLIFPNPRNDFQRAPHFDDWRAIDKETRVFMPKNKNVLIRLYVQFIRRKMDFLALLLWKMMYAKKKKGNKK